MSDVNQRYFDLQGNFLTFKDNIKDSLESHFTIGENYYIVEVFSYNNYINRYNTLKDLRFKIEDNEGERWIFALGEGKYSLYDYFMSENDIRKAKLNRLK